MSRTPGRMDRQNAPKTFRRNSHPTPYNGDMASAFRSRKNLVCFYCNKRSNIRYDGFMTQWDCTQCDSTNFLDENGEITDPPVATDSPAPRNLQYAIPRPNSPPPSQGANSELFCSTCLKNQHLFTASLAQYEVELDTRDPEYRQKEKEYFAFRKRLEKLYPQVCVDCEPRVLGRMKEAGMTAKADHLRRMMDKSRARRSQKVRVFTKTKTMEVLGKMLWYLGLFGQLSWSISALLRAAIFRYSTYSTIFPLVSSFWIEEILYVFTSNTWIRSGIWSSILSFWWNPMFSQMHKGFMNHIVGFGDWYKLQALMLISRSIFYSVSGTGVLADPLATPNIGAHIVILVYILFLVQRSNSSLKVDMAPLWQSTPERLVNVNSRPKQSTSQESESLADILDSIATAPVVSPTRASRRSDQAERMNSYSTPMQAHSRRPIALQESPSSSIGRLRNSFQSTSARDVANTLATGSPATPYSGVGDEMDWTPAKVESEHRAFRPVKSTESGSGAFNQSPVAEEFSPFWYKVPPAPTTPAQRLRNPPNQPRLRVVPSAEKENFFNSLTRQNLVKNTEVHNNERTAADMELRQPKFFAPAPKSEVRDSLADMLTSFSLESSDPQTPVPVEKKLRFQWDHFGQFIILALGFWFWNHAHSSPEQHSKRPVMLSVLIGCLAVGARTILNHLLLEVERKSLISKYIGLALGMVESIAAVYGLVEVEMGRAERSSFSSLGTVLIGGMMIQEFSYAAFG